MSNLRERKAVSAFAAAQDATNAAEQSGALPADAALSRAAKSSASSSFSLFRFLPYMVLFITVFLLVSLATTGTLTYGIESSQLRQMGLDRSSITKQIDFMKIKAQEFAGLRTPAATATAAATSTPTTPVRPANTGYGGVTPKKKKNKKKKTKVASAADSAATDAAGISPSMLGIGGDSDEDENDAPKEIVITPRPLEHDFGALYLSVDELAKYDGADGGPIFLAIYGRIFDVTEGKGFYGPGASYSSFAARDASRAFATNCYNSKNLFDLRGITPEQKKSIDHWYNFYNTHARYTAIGWVNLPELDDNEPLPDDECLTEKAE